MSDGVVETTPFFALCLSSTSETFIVEQYGQIYGHSAHLWQTWNAEVNFISSLQKFQRADVVYVWGLIEESNLDKKYKGHKKEPLRQKTKLLFKRVLFPILRISNTGLPYSKYHLVTNEINCSKTNQRL